MKETKSREGGPTLGLTKKAKVNQHATCGCIYVDPQVTYITLIQVKTTLNGTSNYLLLKNEIISMLSGEPSLRHDTAS